MRATADCSQTISGEHYVSAAILSEFGNLRTSGLPWFGPGETLVGINSLRSNILCTRHNSALAPLDAEGRRALVGIRECLNHISRRSLSTKTLYRIASGDALELWGLKTLMGLLEANVARTEGESTARGYSIDDAVVVQALSGGGLPRGYGLYIGHDSDLLHDTIGFAPLTHFEERRVAGLRVSFLGIVLDFMIDPGTAAAILQANDPHYRPTILDFEGRRRTGRLILTRADQRGDCQRLHFQIRHVPTTAAEASELQDRWARKQFERVPDIQVGDQRR
ncbi:MAG TPA: hypothetical protein VGW40_02055 [Allosphingosinicella sp.]|nr:hypothetical protein [Allosphingosinicella sp.]